MSEIKEQMQAYAHRSMITLTGLAGIIGIPSSQMGTYLYSDEDSPKYDALVERFLEGTGKRLEEIQQDLNQLRVMNWARQLSPSTMAVVSAKRRFLHWQRAQLMADAMIPMGRQMGRPVFRKVSGDR